jgi:hypothetical protein
LPVTAAQRGRMDIRTIFQDMSATTVFTVLVAFSIVTPVMQEDPVVQDSTFKRLSVDLSLHGIFCI